MIREKIHFYLKEKKMTLKYLSEKTGINQGSISSFLGGKRPLSNANIETILYEMGLTLSVEEKQQVEQENI